MPSVVVRPAAAKDFEVVTELLAELGRPHVPDDSVDVARWVYERHLKKPECGSLVAEHDGNVVGFLSLEFRERLNRARPQAWIPDLIVTESARGTGIGKALLVRALADARDRGCWSVTLESGRSRHVAHELYRSLGMVDEGDYFILYY